MENSVNNVKTDKRGLEKVLSLCSKEICDTCNGWYINHKIDIFKNKINE